MLTTLTCYRDVVTYQHGFARGLSKLLKTPNDYHTEKREMAKLGEKVYYFVFNLKRLQYNRFTNIFEDEEAVTHFCVFLFVAHYAFRYISNIDLSSGCY